MLSNEDQKSIPRRAVLAWFGRAAALFGLPSGIIEASNSGTDVTRITAHGYGRDPNLIHPDRPWPLTLTSAQRSAVGRLADLFLPADAHGPLPSTVGIAAFFDEWLSAPYPEQRADRAAILAGLARLEQDASGAAGKAAADLDLQRAVEIGGAEFMKHFRGVCLLGYYTSDAGMQDIGYVAPTPAAQFDGPPAAVRARLGV